MGPRPCRGGQVNARGGTQQLQPRRDTLPHRHARSGVHSNHRQVTQEVFSRKDLCIPMQNDSVTVGLRSVVKGRCVGFGVTQQCDGNQVKIGPELVYVILNIYFHKFKPSGLSGR